MRGLHIRSLTTFQNFLPSHCSFGETQFEACLCRTHKLADGAFLSNVKIYFHLNGAANKQIWHNRLKIILEKLFANGIWRCCKIVCSLEWKGMVVQENGVNVPTELEIHLMLWGNLFSGYVVQDKNIFGHISKKMWC